MKSILQNKRLHQLRKQLVRLQKRVEQHRLTELSIQKRRQIAQRIDRLYKRLSKRMNLHKLPWVAASALALSWAGESVQAQSFAAPVQGAYNMDSTVASDGITAPHLIDIDGDGDLDLFVTAQDPNSSSGSSIMYYQENIGTPTAPNFGPIRSNAYGLSFSQLDSPLPEFADMDGDGDYDLLNTQFNFYAYSNTIQYLENLGSATAPDFSGNWVPNPFSLDLEPSDGLVFLSSIADLDADGDLDVVAYNYNYYGYNSFYYYHRNVGTPSAADFTGTPDSLAPFGLDTMGQRAFQDFVDFDGDGDLDAFYSDVYSYDSVHIYYQENIGTDTLPVFDMPQTNPFGIQSDFLVTGAFVTSGDLDGDGNIDLLVGNYYGDLYFYRQTVGVATETPEQAPFEMLVAPNPIRNTLQVRIQTTETLPNARIQVLDVLGRTVHQEIRDLQDAEWLRIPSEDWPVGVYYLQVQQGDYQFSQSLRKQ